MNHESSIINHHFVAWLATLNIILYIWIRDLILSAKLMKHDRPLFFDHWLMISD